MRDVVAATGRRVYELKAENAIHFGDLSALQLMHQRGDLHDDYLDDDSDRLCVWAGGEGQLEILKWLRENDFPWDSETCEFAAMNGHLEVLQRARAHGCRRTVSMCSKAAQGGHLAPRAGFHQRDVK